MNEFDFAFTALNFKIDAIRNVLTDEQKKYVDEVLTSCKELLLTYPLTEEQRLKLEGYIYVPKESSETLSEKPEH